MLKMLFSKSQTECGKTMENLELTVSNNYIDTYKQAIVPLQNDHDGSPILAYELLNRSNSKSGFRSPDHFYSFAASHCQIYKVDTFVMKLGLQRLLSSKLENPPEHLFVNVHLSTLFSSEWESIVPVLKKSPIPIVLELSEREGLEEYTKAEVIQKMREMRELDLKIAVDDIGKGYSGLYTLTIVHPDFVKIDRELVRDIEIDRYRQHMMKALVEYWLSEEVAIIVEGIERREEAQFFQKLGVTYAQGYYYHRPEMV